MHLLQDYEFELPSELIARFPAATRTGSRLLRYNKVTEQKEHLQFPAILSLIQPGDLLIFNNTKVVKARLFGQKKSGGRLEILVERILNKQEVLAQMKVSKPPKAGDQLFCSNGVVFEVLQKKDRFYHLKLQHPTLSITEVLELIGEVPIPPYFERETSEIDHTRYQTVYALHEGSVAAPTAGFHFDEDLLMQLRAKGVEMGFLTLHIGAGTFLPVKTPCITDHTMHHEYFELSQDLVDKINVTKKAGKRVIAVGTTSVRALEAASLAGSISAYQGETDIFIYPGFQFKTVDAMLTNFHLPGSSLIMLVAAFAGFEATLSLYKDAIKEKYRFFSYGDAMFIESLKNV